jgi:hypothetical protein
MKLTDLRNLINEEIQYVLNTEAFGQGGKNVQIGTGAKGKGGKRFFQEPETVTLTKDMMDAYNNEYPNDFVYDNRINVLYISALLYQHLHPKTFSPSADKKLGRKTIQSTENFSVPVRNILTKHVDNKTITKKINGKEVKLHPVMVKIESKDEEGNIIFFNPKNKSVDWQSKTISENLINEVMTAMQEEPRPPIDEIGKLYQVKLADGKMTKEEMVCEVTVFDDINIEETSGIYKNPSEARRHANEILKEYEDKLEEVKAAMEEYRKNKAENDKLKLAAKDKINGIKGPHNKK